MKAIIKFNTLKGETTAILSDVINVRIIKTCIYLYQVSHTLKYRMDNLVEFNLYDYE